MMAKDVTVKLVSAVVLVIGVMLSGCVTTTDSRFSREADRQKALNNYVQLATAYIGQGNLDRARDHLERALEIDSRSAPALAARGLVLSAEGEESLAEKSFRDAIASDGDYTRGRVYYGAFLYSLKRFEATSLFFANVLANHIANRRRALSASIGSMNNFCAHLG